MTKIYWITADSGGGDDFNPYPTQEAARARILAVDGEDATGLEIWEADAGEDIDDEIACGRARCVWQSW
jgi:hypothetical protein